MSLDPNSFKQPVFWSQGEALVEEVSRNPFVYRFLEPVPSCGFNVGDIMPSQWDIIPANKAARDLLEREQFGDDEEPDLDEFLSVEGHD